MVSYAFSANTELYRLNNRLKIKVRVGDYGSIQPYHFTKT